MLRAQNGVLRKRFIMLVYFPSKCCARGTPQHEIKALVLFMSAAGRRYFYVAYLGFLSGAMINTETIPCDGISISVLVKYRYLTRFFTSFGIAFRYRNSCFFLFYSVCAVFPCHNLHTRTRKPCWLRPASIHVPGTSVGFTRNFCRLYTPWATIPGASIYLCRNTLGAGTYSGLAEPHPLRYYRTTVWLLLVS